MGMANMDIRGRKGRHSPRNGEKAENETKTDKDPQKKERLKNTPKH